MQEAIGNYATEDGNIKKGKKKRTASKVSSSVWYTVEKDAAERFFSATRDLVEEVLMWQFNCKEIEDFIREFESFKRLVHRNMANEQSGQKTSDC